MRRLLLLLWCLWRMLLVLFFTSRAPSSAQAFCLFSRTIATTTTKNSFSALHSSSKNSFEELEQELLQSVNVSSEKESTLRNDHNGWMTIDWNETLTWTKPPSAVEALCMDNNRLLYIKRDDQLQLPSGIAGNKARKLASLEYLPSDHPFPKCIVSYGGPQSNSMLALAALCHFRNRTRFVYYTKTLPKFLQHKPTGNLFRALALGMELRQVSNQQYQNWLGGYWGGSTNPPLQIKAPLQDQSLWMPQGGAGTVGRAGATQLAREVLEFWHRQHCPPLTVCLPAGTGSTALWLHHGLRRLMGTSWPNDDIQVVAIPCVGDAGYTRRQMMHGNAQAGMDPVDDIPAILPPLREAVPFGEPHPRVLDTYRYFQEQHGLTVDLLYGAPALRILLDHMESSRPSLLNNRMLLYVHSGGLEGISSQLGRYRFKGLIDNDELENLI